MAIQLPDVGTGVPADQTGDSPWLAMKKVRENFNDQTNAASKLVGTANGQIPLAQDVFRAASSLNDGYITSPSFDIDTLRAGRVLVNGSVPKLPIMGDTHWYVETKSKLPYVEGEEIQQFAFGLTKPVYNARTKNAAGVWSEWTPLSTNPMTYAATTASGANVAVDSTGKLMRSTSSERYKDILAPLELDDARYADAMALQPIVYRSTADADNPAYHYYSFSAEELGEYDPAFTLWRETETVTDADGNVIEQPLAERQAEGININALLAMSHAIAIKQGKIIKALEVRIEILEAK